MHLAVEIVHHERAKNGNLVVLGEAVELILQIHASRDVSLLPKHVYHFAPPSDFRIPCFPARFGNDIRRQTKEYRGIGHGVSHETWQKLVRVNDCELSTPLSILYVHALGFQTGTKCIPMGSGGHENDTLAIGNRASREPTNGAIEKLLVLIKLHDVIAGPSGGQEAVPRLVDAQGGLRCVAIKVVHTSLRLR